MRMNASVLQKLEALIATGMPGAHKVLIFFLIKSIYGVSELGNIASLFSVAQIIGFFTAIGWSTLILVRVAKAIDQSERIGVLNKLMSMSFITLIVSCVLILLFGASYQKMEKSIDICLLLIGWTFYQIPRHYFIALRQYRRAVLLDMAILLISIVGLFFANEENISIALSLPMILSGAFSFFFLRGKSCTGLLRLNYEIRGLEFGLTNFLSGGIWLSLIPLAKYFEGADFAGVLSLFLSVSAFSLLLPRAISLNQLSAIAKGVADKEKLRRLVGKMREQIFLINLMTSVFSVCVAIYFLLNLPENVNFLNVFNVMLLITLQNFISTQSLVGSNVVMAAEMSRPLLIVSSIVTVLFSSAAFLFFKIPVNNSFLWLCFLMVLLNLFRLYVVRSKLNSVLS